MGWRDQIAKALTGIKAYHSSPHDFDRFDLSKIGTGEGAQVYGHGIYAAENPAVSGQGGQYWQQFKGRFSGAERDAADTLSASGFNRDEALGSLQQHRDRLHESIKSGDLHPADAADALQRIKAQEELLLGGQPVGPRTYELNIRADPAQMLDWDKAFKDQSPHVQNVLRDELYLAPTDKETGRELYRQAYPLSASSLDEGRVMATDRMRGAGIPGIRYLDEGSRNATPVLKTTPAGDIISSSYPPPTSNYVVFDPSIIDITKKYAVPGAIGAGAMGGLAAEDQYGAPP